MMRRCLFVAASLLAFDPVRAATVQFPGSGACASDLQACIDAAADGDTVEITAAAADLTGSFLIGKPLTLRSAATARARFVAATLSIDAMRAGGQVVRVSNLIFDDAPIIIAIGNGEVGNTHQVVLDQLQASSSTNTSAIAIAGSTAGSTRKIDISHLDFRGRAGVRFVHGSEYDGLQLRLTDSRFLLSGPASPFQYAFNASGMADGMRIDFLRNDVECVPPFATNARALVIGVISGGLPTDYTEVRFDRNTVRYCASGASFQTADYFAQVRVRNNTFRDVDNAVFFSQSTPERMDWQVSNNIFLVGSRAIFGGVDDVSRRSHNLYAMTSGEPPTAPSLGFEPSAVLAPPKFVGFSDLRPSADSPAVDAGDSARAAPGADRFGVLRRVGASGLVDIGAHEWTDAASDRHRVGFTAPATPLSTTFRVATDPAIASSVFAGNNAPLPAPSNHIGLYPDSGFGQFLLYSEDESMLADSREFFVARTGASLSSLELARDPAYLHTTQVANIVGSTSILPAAWFESGAPSHTPIVIHRRDFVMAPSGGFHNHPIGLRLDSGQWRVFNQDTINFTPNITFHVVVPPAAADYAFRMHTTQAVAALVIDHPRANNNPDARLFVSSADGDVAAGIPGVSVLSPLGVRYDDTTNGGGRWSVVRGDGLDLPANAVVHVYIDPETDRRRDPEVMLRDGFE